MDDWLCLKDNQCFSCTCGSQGMNLTSCQKVNFAKKRWRKVWKCMAQTKMPHQPIRCFLFVKGGNYRNSSMLQWKNTRKAIERIGREVSLFKFNQRIIFQHPQKKDLHRVCSPFKPKHTDSETIGFCCGCSMIFESEWPGFTTCATCGVLQNSKAPLAGTILVKQLSSTFIDHGW